MNQSKLAQTVQAFMTHLHHSTRAARSSRLAGQGFLSPRRLGADVVASLLEESDALIA
jgi:hypothetical protein